MTSLPARVAAHAGIAPARIALVDGERRLDYAAFLAHARAFAAALRAQGLADGDRVAIVLPNRIEAAVAVYGAWMAGGVAVPLNAQARERDLVPWLRHCGAAHLVHEAGHADAERALQWLSAPPLAWPLQPGTPIVPPMPAGDARRADGLDGAGAPRPDEPALIIYTSGTTGAPKGVTLSHANVLANAEAVVDYLALVPDDSVLGLLPFYYAYGASVLHTHLLAGASVVLAPGVMFPHLMVGTAARERVTGLSGVPSTFALLLDRARIADHDLSALRYLTQAGGAMTGALARRVREAFPRARLFVMYGQTEATSRLTWLPPERLDDKAGSVGVPVRGVRLRVVDDDGLPLPPGSEGEVEARGPNLMLGYWRAPEATAAVLRDGWLRTGDVGRLDPDGYLFLRGRRNDMIKTGAHRVHPADVEEVIAQCPGVAESAVAGIDDPLLGQAIRAWVVMRDPQLPDALARLELAIKAHCRAHLAPYKVPRQVTFVDALPRTASGKVRRFALGQAAPGRTADASPSDPPAPQQAHAA